MSNSPIVHVPTGSDESTIIASYFPSGVCFRNSIAVKIKNGTKLKSYLPHNWWSKKCRQMEQGYNYSHLQVQENTFEVKLMEK